MSKRRDAKTSTPTKKSLKSSDSTGPGLRIILTDGTRQRCIGFGKGATRSQTRPRGLNAFFLFMNDLRRNPCRSLEYAAILAEFPDRKVTEALAEAWRRMSSAEQLPYHREAEAAKFALDRPQQHDLLVDHAPTHALHTGRCDDASVSSTARQEGLRTLVCSRPNQVRPTLSANVLDRPTMQKSRSKVSNHANGTHWALLPLQSTLRPHDPVEDKDDHQIIAAAAAAITMPNFLQQRPLALTQNFLAPSASHYETMSFASSEWFDPRTKQGPAAAYFLGPHLLMTAPGMEDS